MKERTKGFLVGLTTACVFASLGSAALAAQRSVMIDDGIRMTVNGANFIPRDQKGNEVPIFTYNGTTYAPVRAVIEAASMKVSYSESNRTVAITTQESSTGAAQYISAEKAKGIAQAKAPGAKLVKCEFDFDDGVPQYEIELRDGRTEYECEIHAVSGEVLKWETDYDD